MFVKSKQQIIKEPLQLKAQKQSSSLMQSLMSSHPAGKKEVGNEHTQCYYHLVNIYIYKYIYKYIYIYIYILYTGTPELGGQEGRSPPLPFARRGKGGRSALWVLKYTWQILRKLFHMV